MLQWAIAHGCPWDESFLANAIRLKEYDVYKWALQNGCPWHSSASSYIAEASYCDKTFTNVNALELLRWSHEYICLTQPSATFWGEDLFYNFIVSTGNYDGLRWAISKGCPWQPSTAFHLVETLNLDILEWAIREGCPWDEASSAFGNAAYNCVMERDNDNDSAMVVDSDLHTEYETVSYCLDVFQWCLDNGCAWCTDAVEGVLTCTLEKHESFWGDFLHWLAYQDYPVKNLIRDLKNKCIEIDEDQVAYYVKLFIALRFEKKYKEFTAKELCKEGKYVEAYIIYKRLAEFGSFDAREKLDNTELLFEVAKEKKRRSSRKLAYV
jgi:hypothetical protein